MGELYDPTVKTKQVASTKVFGLDAPHATQIHDIGDRIKDPVTGTVYEYVKAEGAVAANKLVSTEGTNDGSVLLTPASTVGIQACRGASIHAFAAGEYGWIAVRGPVDITAQGTGYVLGDLVMPDVGNTGDIDELVVTTVDPTEAQLRNQASVIGHAMAAESGGTVLVFLTLG